MIRWNVGAKKAFCETSLRECRQVVARCIYTLVKVIIVLTFIEDHITFPRSLPLVYLVRTDLPSLSFLLSSIVSGMNSAWSFAAASSIFRCWTPFNTVVIVEVSQ